MNLFISYKYLVALDEHRHFGRAAQACNVTQPALSNAVRALEESLGVAVVKRGRSFEGFTGEGERVLVTARRMLREQEMLWQDLASSADDPQGRLLMGAVPTCLPIAARFVAMLQDKYPRIVPTVMSMSSAELEAGVESLSLDLALGYPERLKDLRAPLRMVPQYSERYFLLRRAAQPSAHALAIGPTMRWADAARLPLCLLGREMHNRTIIDRAFAAVGEAPQPAIETNSILTLALSVAAGRVCSVMPGALVDVVRGYRELEALPLVEPHVEVPIALMVHDLLRPSRTLEAALAFAQSEAWLQQARLHSGALALHAAPPS